MRRPATIALLLAVIPACHRDMRDQPRYDTLEASSLFANHQSARPTPAGTVARRQLPDDEVISTGKQNGSFVGPIPVTLDAALLNRGQERFNIYCAPCHDRTGSGDGIIVQRGFRRPPSFHLERLRSMPAGHYFDVMTHGFGAMPRYGAHVAPRDRWAIVAYIRALQLSQNAALDDVPADERARLSEANP